MKMDRTIAVIGSFIIQSILGIFLGHQYDMGIFYTAGFAVSQGLAPYGIFPVQIIFNNPALFEELPGIGYPPLWGIYLGIIYRIIYIPTNIFVYNYFIKIPSIISNIVLAFIAERIAYQEGVEKKHAKKIFYLVLFLWKE